MRAKGKKSAMCEKNDEINEWWHFWWIRIDNRRHFMLLNISTSHKQTSLAIFHIMQNKFHTSSTSTSIIIICVSLSSLQFFIFYFVSIDNSVLFFLQLVRVIHSAVFSIVFLQCVELLAWKSFHLWNFSTCFFQNDWRQDTSNVSTRLFALFDVSFSLSASIRCKRKRDGIRNVNFDFAINPFLSIFVQTKRTSSKSVQHNEGKICF